MISRNWTGLCKREKANDYIQHLREDTFQSIKKIDGFIRASILKREVSDGIEFLIVTEWESLNSIRQFAGNSYETSVVPEIVKEMMVRYDENVRHYEINFTTGE
jgi:heme-degrading monooxygenase HmoA